MSFSLDAGATNHAFRVSFTAARMSGKRNSEGSGSATVQPAKKRGRRLYARKATDTGSMERAGVSVDLEDRCFRSSTQTLLRRETAKKVVGEALDSLPMDFLNAANELGGDVTPCLVSLADSLPDLPTHAPAVYLGEMSIKALDVTDGLLPALEESSPGLSLKSWMRRVRRMAEQVSGDTTIYMRYAGEVTATSVVKRDGQHVEGGSAGGAAVYDPIRGFADQHPDIMGFSLKTVFSWAVIKQLMHDLEMEEGSVTDHLEALVAELALTSMAHLGTNVAPCGQCSMGWQGGLLGFVNREVVKYTSAALKDEGREFVVRDSPEFEARKKRLRREMLFNESPLTDHPVIVMVVDETWDGEGRTHVTIEDLVSKMASRNGSTMNEQTGRQAKYQGVSTATAKAIGGESPSRSSSTDPCPPPPGSP